MRRNFYSTNEVAELLNKEPAEVKQACKSIGIEQVEGVYLVAFWRLPEIKQAMEARADK